MEQNLTLKKLLILLIILITSFIGTILIFSLIASLAPNWILTTEGKLTLQALQTIIIFGCTPIIGISFLEKKNPFKVTSLYKITNWRNTLIILIFAFTALPTISWLAELNNKMSLPSFLSNWEIWMKEMEENSRLLTEEFINTKSPLRLSLNIIIMALLPAICEELMFRGWLQRVLCKFTNYHTAIWTAAFIFSAIHFQFYGFIPRMIIGAGLGYIYYYTGTLWGSILAHFINNTVVVFTGYLAYNEISNINFDAIGTGDMWPISIACGIISVILIIKLKQQNKIK